jgi:transcriptional regulator with XRE-family HTH domain
MRACVAPIKNREDAAMAKRKTRHRPKAESDDGLVWFSPFVVRGIMNQKGLTVSRLARMADRNHQTVSSLLAGDQMKRARPGLLRAIANALDVAPALIQQPPEQLIESMLHPVRGFEHEYSVLTAFEVTQLIDKCVTASKRDVAFWRDWLGGIDAYDEAVPRYVRAAFSLLLTIGYHRSRWLVPFTPDSRQHMISPRGDRTGAVPDLPSPHWHPLRGYPREDKQHEIGLVSLVQSYEQILRPWLDAADGVGFNYVELRQQAVREARHGLPRLGWRPAPSIGDEWMPSFADVPAPPHRATEARDPYRLLGLGGHPT